MNRTKTKELIMNDTANPEQSGSVELLAELRAAVGTFPPTAEQMERNKARKSDLDFQAMKRRADRREHHLAEPKEKVRQKLRGAIDYE